VRVVSFKPWHALLLLCTCVGMTGVIAGVVVLVTRLRRRG
jgi:hypothetical protein